MATLSATPYQFDYDKAYSKAKESPFFSESEWKRYLKNGNVDLYLDTMSKSSSFDKNTLEKEYNNIDFGDDERKTLALMNELYSNKTDKKTYDVYDQQGNLHQESMTEYDYNKYSILQRNAYDQAQYEQELAEQKKKEENTWLELFGASVAATGAEFVKGIYDVTHSIDSFVRSGLEASSRAISGDTNFDFLELMQSYRDNDVLYHKYDDWLTDFETANTWFRYSDGTLATGGRYFGQAAKTLGQMIPGAMVGYGVGSAATALGVSTKVATVASGVASRATFYGAITLDRISEGYQLNALEGTSLGNWSIVGNAVLKSAVEIAVEELLGKILGRSGVDMAMYGLRGSAQSGAKMLAQKSTGLTRQAILRVFKDMGREGLEEVLQDTATWTIDQAFSEVSGNSAWTKLTEGQVSPEQLVETFLVSALTSFAGDGFNIIKAGVKQSYITGKIKKLQAEVNSGKLTQEQAQEKNSEINNLKLFVADTINGKKANYLAAWEYGLDLESFMTNTKAIMEFADKNYSELTAKEKESVGTAMREAYSAYRILSSVYTEIGSESAIAVNQYLKEMSDAMRNGDYDKVSPSDYATTLVWNFISEKEYFSDNLRNYVESNNAKPVAVVDEESDGSTGGLEDSAIEALKASIDGENIKAIVVTDKEITPKTVDKVAVIGKNSATNASDTEIANAISESMLIDMIANSKKIPEDVFNKFISIAQSLIKRAKKPIDKAYVARRLLFDTKFFNAVLTTSTKECFDVLRSLSDILINVKDSKRTKITVALENKINKALDSMRTSMTEFAKNQPYPGILEQVVELYPAEERNKVRLEIAKANPYYMLREILVSKKKLSEKQKENAIALVKKIANFNGVPKDEIDAFERAMAGWYNNPSKNGLAVNKLDIIGRRLIGNYYGERFDGKMNFLKPNTFANTVFNQFLEANNLRLSTLFDESKLPEEDKDSLVIADGSIVKLREMQFKSFAPNFTFSYYTDKDNVVHISEVKYTGENWYGFYEVYDKSTNKNAVPLKDEDRNVAFPGGKKSSKILPYVDENNYSIVDASVININTLIANPNMLRKEHFDKIKEKFGVVGPYEAYIYLKRQFIDNSEGKISIAQNEDGTFSFVDLTPMFGVLTEAASSPESFSELVIKKKGKVSITSLVQEEFLVGYLKSIKVVFKAFGSEYVDGRYNYMTNEIELNSTLLDKKNENVLISKFCHEFGHAIQFFNFMSNGTSGDILQNYYNNDADRKAIVKKFETLFPELFNGAKNEKEKIGIVDILLYYTTGEYQADGYEGSEYSIFIPTLSRYESTGTTASGAPIYNVLVAPDGSVFSSSPRVTKAKATVDSLLKGLEKFGVKFSNARRKKNILVDPNGGEMLGMYDNKTNDVVNVATDEIFARVDSKGIVRDGAGNIIGQYDKDLDLVYQGNHPQNGLKNSNGDILISSDAEGSYLVDGNRTLSDMKGMFTYLCSDKDISDLGKLVFDKAEELGIEKIIENFKVRGFYKPAVTSEDSVSIDDTIDNRKAVTANVILQYVVNEIIQNDLATVQQALIDEDSDTAVNIDGSVDWTNKKVIDRVIALDAKGNATIQLLQEMCKTTRAFIVKNFVFNGVVYDFGINNILDFISELQNQDFVDFISQYTSVEKVNTLASAIIGLDYNSLSDADKKGFMSAMYNDFGDTFRFYNLFNGQSVLNSNVYDTSEDGKLTLPLSRKFNPSEIQSFLDKAEKGVEEVSEDGTRVTKYVKTQKKDSKTVGKVITYQRNSETGEIVEKPVKTSVLYKEGFGKSKTKYVKKSDIESSKLLSYFKKKSGQTFINEDVYAFIRYVEDNDIKLHNDFMEHITGDKARLTRQMIVDIFNDNFRDNEIISDEVFTAINKTIFHNEVLTTRDKLIEFVDDGVPKAFTIYKMIQDSRMTKDIGGFLSTYILDYEKGADGISYIDSIQQILDAKSKSYDKYLQIFNKELSLQMQDHDPYAVRLAMEYFTGSIRSAIRITGNILYALELEQKYGFYATRKDVGVRLTRSGDDSTIGVKSKSRKASGGANLSGVGKRRLSQNRTIVTAEYEGFNKEFESAKKMAISEFKQSVVDMSRDDKISTILESIVEDENLRKQVVELAKQYPDLREKLSNSLHNSDDAALVQILEAMYRSNYGVINNYLIFLSLHNLNEQFDFNEPELQNDISSTTPKRFDYTRNFKRAAMSANNRLTKKEKIRMMNDPDAKGLFVMNEKNGLITPNEDLYKRQDGRLRDEGTLSDLDKKYTEISGKIRDGSYQSDKTLEKYDKMMEQAKKTLNESIEAINETKKLNKQLSKKLQQATEIRTQKFSTISSQEMPASVQSIIGSYIDQQSKTNVQIYSLENEHRAKISYQNIIDSNPIVMQSLGEDASVATMVAEYFLNSDAVPNSNGAEIFIGVQTVCLAYIYNAIKTGAIKVDEDLEGRIRDRQVGTIRLSSEILNIQQGILMNLNPQRRILMALARRFDLDPDKDPTLEEKLEDAIRQKNNGNVKGYADAVHSIEQYAAERYAKFKPNLFENLLEFERVSMLSSPGTWVRNWVTNRIIESGNKIGDSTLRKIANSSTGVSSLINRVLFGNTVTKDLVVYIDNVGGQVIRRDPTSGKYFTRRKDGNGKWSTVEIDEKTAKSGTQQYLLYNVNLDTKSTVIGTRIDEDTKKEVKVLQFADKDMEYFNKNFMQTGFYDTVALQTSRYDAKEVASRKSRTFEQLIIQKVREDVMNGIVLPADAKPNSKIAQSYTKWKNFVWDRMSDDKFVQRSVQKNYARLMKIKGYDSETLNAMSEESIEIFKESYILAGEEYMHKPNFLTQAEFTIKNRLDNTFSDAPWKADAIWLVYKTIVPFAGPNWNWFVAGLKLTPYGLVDGLIKLGNLQNTVEKIEYARQHGNRVTSPKLQLYLIQREITAGAISSVICLVGLALSCLGILRADDDDRGKIKLNFFNLIDIDLSEVHGLQGLYMGAMVVEAIKKGIASGKKGDFGTALYDTLVSAIDIFVKDSTFEDLFDTFQQGDSFGEILASVPSDFISMLVPNLLKSVFRVLDHSGGTTYGSGTLATMRRFLATTLPVTKNFYMSANPYTGEYNFKYFNKMDAGTAFGTILMNVINQGTNVKLSAHSKSSIEKKCNENGVAKKAITCKYTVNGEKVNLGLKETQSAQSMYGEKNKTDLSNFFANKVAYKIDGKTLHYSQMSTEQRKQVIERIMENNAQITKIYYLTQGSKNYKYYATESEYKSLLKAGAVRNVYLKTSKLEGFVK